MKILRFPENIPDVPCGAVAKAATEGRSQRERTRLWENLNETIAELERLLVEHKLESAAKTLSSAERLLIVLQGAYAGMNPYTRTANAMLLAQEQELSRLRALMNRHQSKPKILRFPSAGNESDTVA